MPASSAGGRVGVVGWKTLGRGEWSGTFSPIFAPRSSSTPCVRSPAAPSSSVDVTAVLTQPRARSPRHSARPTRSRSSSGERLALLCVGDGLARRRAPGVTRARAVPSRAVGRRAAQPTTRCRVRSGHRSRAAEPVARGGSSSGTPRSAASACGVATARAAGSSARVRTDLRAQSEGYIERLVGALLARRWRPGTRRWRVGVPGGDVFATVTEPRGRGVRARRSTPVT